MSVLWAALGTIAYYLLFVGWMDRRTAPAWEVRDNYRLLSMGLVFMLMGLVVKALLWYTELRQVIAGCP